MQYVIEKCKNGSDTCVINNKKLHSSYNPQNEAAQFVKNINTDFTPSLIIIIEPGFSYCTQLLRNKYPDCKIAALHYSHTFDKTNNQWDYVFYHDKQLTDNLFYTCTEDLLCNCAVFEWPASKIIFHTEITETWLYIKEAIKKATTVLSTRKYFGERWLKNIFTYVKNTTNYCSIGKIDKDILITASGPSLKSSIEYIKNYRNDFFLICVSSALTILLYNGITPDLVISTDGGFWAKKHLLVPGYDISDIVFAIAPQGACPKQILHKNKVIPLCYGDGLETSFFKYLSLPYIQAVRNGTVSGTALQLALSLTKNNIYMAGLDQCPASGYQHSQPNALEIINTVKDSALKNTITRLTTSQFNSEQSLSVYRSWFITNSKTFSNRVYRISQNYTYAYELGFIKDISWTDYKNKNIKLNKQYIYSEDVNKTDFEKKIISYITELKNNTDFVKEFLPLDYIMYTRNKSSENLESLNKSINSITSSLIKMFNIDESI